MLLETQTLIDSFYRRYIGDKVVTKGIVCQDLVAKQNTWAVKQEFAQPGRNAS
jgi:hypothetical protein